MCTSQPVRPLAAAQRPSPPHAPRTQLPGVYHIPGVGATLAIVLVNCVRREDVSVRALTRALLHLVLVLERN